MAIFFIDSESQTLLNRSGFFETTWFGLRFQATVVTLIHIVIWVIIHFLNVWTIGDLKEVMNWISKVELGGSIGYPIKDFELIPDLLELCCFLQVVFSMVLLIAIFRKDENLMKIGHHGIAISLILTAVIVMGYFMVLQFYGGFYLFFKVIFTEVVFLLLEAYILKVILQYQTQLELYSNTEYITF